MGVKGIQQGEYSISIRDERGEEIRRIERVSKKRFPIVGEGMQIENAFFRVVDVHHVDDEPEGFRQFVYTDLLVIVKEVHYSPPSPSKKEDESPADRGHAPIAKPSASALTNVIPFAPVALSPSSPLFGFFGLITLAVYKGYQQQAHELELLKVEAWQLTWSGKHWVVDALGGLNATALRALSRAAKQEATLALNFLAALARSSEEHRLVATRGLDLVEPGARG